MQAQIKRLPAISFGAMEVRAREQQVCTVQYMYCTYLGSCSLDPAKLQDAGVQVQNGSNHARGCSSPHVLGRYPARLPPCFASSHPANLAVMAVGTYLGRVSSAMVEHNIRARWYLPSQVNVWPGRGLGLSHQGCTPRGLHEDFTRA